MFYPSVFAQQAELPLLLDHDVLVLCPQAVKVTGEDERVAVQTRAVKVELPAGIVDGVVVVVGVDHPVVVVWEAHRRGGEDLPPAAGPSCAGAVHQLLAVACASIN